MWARDGQELSLCVGEETVSLDDASFPYSELRRWAQNEGNLSLLRELLGQPTELELRAASTAEAESVVSAIGVCQHVSSPLNSWMTPHPQRSCS